MKTFVVLSILMGACLLQFAEGNEECDQTMEEMKAIVRDMPEEEMPQCCSDHNIPCKYDGDDEEIRQKMKEFWKGMKEKSKEEWKAVKECLREVYETIKEKMEVPPTEECEKYWKKNYMKCRKNKEEEKDRRKRSAEVDEKDIDGEEEEEEGENSSEEEK